MTDFTGKARLAGVIGWPISHSRSPILHQYWLRQYQIDGVYIPMAVAPEHLAQAIDGLVALHFGGVNITLPHKEKMLDLVDELDPAARRIGAVNTLVISDDGRKTGYNTDSHGFIAHLRQQYPDRDLRSSRVGIIGAGGAARAIMDGFLAAGCQHILLTNRNPDRAYILAEHYHSYYPHAVIEVVGWNEAAEQMAVADILVQTTSLGMTGQPVLDFSLSAFSSQTLVCDIVYNPLMTGLLEQARHRNMPVLDGLGMLLHQAAPGFAAWFGQHPIVDQGLRDAVLR